VNRSAVWEGEDMEQGHYCLPHYYKGYFFLSAFKKDKGVLSVKGVIYGTPKALPIRKGNPELNLPHSLTSL
jgi:hypothetical protein